MDEKSTDRYIDIQTNIRKTVTPLSRGFDKTYFMNFHRINFDNGHVLCPPPGDHIVILKGLSFGKFRF